MATTTRAAARTRGDRAFLIEIYSGIQGEGLLVGERQIFFRFTGCNLTCDYCDTPMTRPLDTVARVEVSAGAREFETAVNPIGRDDALRYVDRLCADRSLHEWISLTGGEPLLYWPYLARLLPELAERGLRVYLETNGTLPEALERVIDGVEIVAMDVKEAGDGSSLEEHWAFLRVALRKKVFVKAVVRPDPDLDHFRRVAEGIAAIDPTVPLVLQPLSPYGPWRAGPSPAAMLDLQATLKSLLPTVRVIPQTHKFIGQL